MRKILFIAAGGSAGAVLRYLIEQLNAPGYSGIPFDTLAINLIGCFFLAFILALLESNTDLRLGISVGLLGAFTTFSTLCKETVSLISDGSYFSAALYVFASAFLGVAAAYLGLISARRIARRDFSKEINH